MKKLLCTERLYLRNLREEDAQALFACRNDPGCARFQRWEDTTMEAIRSFIGRFRESEFLSEQPEQHYAICGENGLAGDLSCFYTERDNCVTLGITVIPERQGQGFAREILGAVISAIQNRYPQADIVALIDPENGASIALFEKLGFYRECYAESIRSCVYVIDGRRGE